MVGNGRPDLRDCERRGGVGSAPVVPTCGSRCAIGFGKRVQDCELRSAPDTPGTTNVLFGFVLALASNPKQDGERRGYVTLAKRENFHKLSERSSAIYRGFPRQMQENRAPASMGCWLSDRLGASLAEDGPGN